MKNKLLKIALLGATCLALSSKIYSQATNGALINNVYSPIGYIGWSGTNGINPLFFRTNATDRMVINGNKTVGINGFLGLAITHNILIFLAYNFNQRSGFP